jgi:hypothetical protein
MSIRTAEVYMGWVRRFILFHHKQHPKEMGTEEMRAFLTHLVVLAVDGMSQSAGERGGFAYSAAHAAQWRTGPRHDVTKGGARASETTPGNS